MIEAIVHVIAFWVILIGIILFYHHASGNAERDQWRKLAILEQLRKLQEEKDARS